MLIALLWRLAHLIPAEPIKSTTFAVRIEFELAGKAGGQIERGFNIFADPSSLPATGLERNRSAPEAGHCQTSPNRLPVRGRLHGMFDNDRSLFKICHAPARAPRLRRSTRTILPRIASHKRAQPRSEPHRELS
jgi:hypothetical protein